MKEQALTQRRKGKGKDAKEIFRKRKSLEGAALTEDTLSNQIIKAAIEVHRTLGGPGLLESVYEEALVWELQADGLQVERQKQLPITYKQIVLADPLRLDVVVNNLVIVECKAVVNYHPIFEAQALTYLRITDLRLALVINFGEKMLKQGIHRVVNSL